MSALLESLVRRGQSPLVDAFCGAGIFAKRLAPLFQHVINPTTLARDLAELAGSYTLSSVTPLDMFPQAAEIEVVAHLIASAPAPVAQ